MRYTSRLSLALGLLSLAAAPVAAQQIPSPYRHIEERMSLGFEAGYLLASGLDPDLGPRSAPIGAARFLIRIAAPVSGEIAVGFAPSEREIFANAPIAGRPNEFEPQPIGTASVPLVLVEGGFRLHLTGPRTWNQLAPFASATLGAAFNLRGATDAERELPTNERFGFGPGFALGVGTGTDLFLSDRTSLRLDLRNRIWRLKTPQGFTGTAREQTTWTNNPSISIGAAYHF